MREGKRECVYEREEKRGERDREREKRESFFHMINFFQRS